MGPIVRVDVVTASQSSSEDAEIFLALGTSCSILPFLSFLCDQTNRLISSRHEVQADAYTAAALVQGLGKGTASHKRRYVLIVISATPTRLFCFSRLAKVLLLKRVIVCPFPVLAYM